MGMMAWLLILWLLASVLVGVCLGKVIKRMDR